MMRQARLCIVLLILGLGGYGLPDRGFAQDYNYTQNENFGLNPGLHVEFTVVPPKNTRGDDAIVTKGFYDNAGGFVWAGQRAHWTATIPPEFSGQHKGHFYGEYTYPGTGTTGRALTWQANTEAEVVKVDIEQTEKNVSSKMTSASMNLTFDSYLGDGTANWSSSPSGISGSGRSITFIPSSLTPAAYVVTARSSLLPSCRDNCLVRVLETEFSVDEDYASFNQGIYDAKARLTADSYDKEDLSWTLMTVAGDSETDIDDDGLVIFGTGGGKYTIRATANKLGGCYAEMTLFVIKVDMDHDLWWFGGTDAANYDESATLTANGVTVGTFSWQVVQGGSRIVLNNGGADSWNITATDDNTIVVKSTDYSASPLDATIRFSLNDVAVCDYKLSVYSPMTAERVSGPVDDTYQIIGFQSVYKFKVLDNFGNLLPKEIEVNEGFGSWIPDWTIANGRATDENWWPLPTPNGVMTGAETPIHFTETYAYSTWLLTPGTVNPGATHYDESVIHATQTYKAGSTTVGDGVVIKSHTEQLYRGQGRQQ